VGSQSMPMHRLNEARCELMVNHLWSQQAKMLWYAGDEDEGVVIKQGRDKYVCCPPDLRRSDGFFDAIQTLNVKVYIYILIVFTHVNQFSERHDTQHTHDQAPRPRQRSKFHSNRPESETPGPP